MKSSREFLYEHVIAAVQPITDMKTLKLRTENYMFKSVRVNPTTLLTLPDHSLSLFCRMKRYGVLLPRLRFPDGRL